MSENTAIVTGASGFIGQALVSLLTEKGWGVVPVGRSAAITWDHLWSGHVDISKIKAVFHLAAYVPPAMEDSSHARECIDVNALLTLRLAEHVAKNSQAHLVLASTGQVYGYSAEPIDETTATHVTGRACFYLSSKLLAESYVQRTSESMDLHSSIIRIGNCYGPGMKPQSLIAFFCRLAREGKPLPLRHKGCEIFDLVEAADVAQCMFKSALMGARGLLHAGTGKAYSVREIAELVNTVFENKAGIEFIEPHSAPKQPGFAPLDISRAKSSLGYVPISLEAGLRKYKSHLESHS